MPYAYLSGTVKAALVGRVLDANFGLDSGARRLLVRVASDIYDDTCTCVRVCARKLRWRWRVSTRTDHHQSPGTAALECGTSGSGGSTSGSSTSTSGGLACRRGLSTGAARARGSCRGGVHALPSLGWRGGCAENFERVRRRGSCRLRVEDPYSAAVTPASLTHSFPNYRPLPPTLSSNSVPSPGKPPRKFVSTHATRSLPTFSINLTHRFRPSDVLSLLHILIVFDNDYGTLYYIEIIYYYQYVGITV